MITKPLLFPSIEELQVKIDAYFADCDENDKPYTVSGLADHLETSRQTLINYEEKAEYFDTIRKAKAKIERYNEEQLYRPQQVAGVIFNLKNNFGWRDAQQLEITNKLDDFIKAFRETDTQAARD